jgi:hypothetical protein
MRRSFKASWPLPILSTIASMYMEMHAIDKSTKLMNWKKATDGVTPLIAMPMEVPKQTVKKTVK